MAEAMVAYLLAAGCEELFDPAVGAGAFFLAAKKVAREMGRPMVCSGTELDPQALEAAKKNGVSDADLAGVRIADFLREPPVRKLKAIIANPPYIRHHRLSAETKSFLRALSVSVVGIPIDGRAGLHVFFLIRALQLLDGDGRLAFIMPADTVEGVFAPALWRWICQHYALEAVVTFAPEASPFPGVDTNPLILMIRNAPPTDRFFWARCEQADTEGLKAWTLSHFQSVPESALSVWWRNLDEGLATGLSRPPREETGGDALKLGDIAAVLRGIATGANDFFHLTQARARQIALPEEFLVPAIARTRDMTGDEVSPETLAQLEAAGRPTLLFSPDGRPMRSFPPAVQAYLTQGEARGIAGRTLIATRRPWYKMERRPVPPILFAYLGRRNTRFIRNRAGVVPLTGFLCVYPLRDDPAYVERVWQVLRHPATITNLSLVGKSYGGGALKVEPRALEALPLPAQVVSAVGLEPPPRSEQLQWCADSRRRYQPR